MSWSELERLVDSAEADPSIRRRLRRCVRRGGGSQELIAMARLLGFRVTPADLRCARVRHRVEQRQRARRRRPTETSPSEACPSAGRLTAARPAPARPAAERLSAG